MFRRLQKTRFSVNINNEDGRYIKETLKIPDDENIIIILDDSNFNDLSRLVVFTDKNIYWNLKNTSMRAKSDSTVYSINGTGFINNKLLNNVSIFSKIERGVKIVYIISDTIQLIIPFNNFEMVDSLKLVFYNYITNYCGGYDPTIAKNEILFKKISKTAGSIKTNIISTILNGISYIIAVLLLFNIIIQFYNINIVTNEKIICIFMVSKLLSILFGDKKSMYSFLLTFILTTDIIMLPEIFYYVKGSIVYLIYAGIILLLNIFDFDKIFKYLTFILTLISAAYMIIKYFNIAAFATLL
jgi:hypothetical protein